MRGTVELFFLFVHLYAVNDEKMQYLCAEDFAQWGSGLTVYNLKGSLLNIFSNMSFFLEIDLLSAFELDQNVVGVDPISTRYRAYQFYMYSKDIKASKYIGNEILENMLSWSEFIIVANVRLDKNGPGALFAVETDKGRHKFVLWMDSPAQKLGIRSHLNNVGKKSITFKKVPFKQQSWHRVVVHLRMLNETKPVVDLYVDCKFVERKHFPMPLRTALLEDRNTLEFHLGQVKNHGRDFLKFVVRIFICRKFILALLVLKIIAASPYSDASRVRVLIIIVIVIIVVILPLLSASSSASLP